MDTCRVCNKQIPIGSLCEAPAHCNVYPIDPEAKCAICGQFFEDGDEFCYKVDGFRKAWRCDMDEPSLTPDYKPIHLRCASPGDW